jgi:two-component system, response regulator, stage 0 sporulation protein F
LKVLVVDDEQDVKLLFEQRFRKEIRSGDLVMLFAFSGEEALRILSQSDAADVMLILSDINMPGMTGLELLKEVKQRLPHLPVMMVTAYGDADTRNRAMESGADEFVTKPIDFEGLRSLIMSHKAGEEKV